MTAAAEVTPKDAGTDAPKALDIANVPQESTQDSSTVQDRSRLNKAFAAVFAALQQYAPAYGITKDMTKVGAYASMDIRESILRANGHPDFAGNTKTYAAIWGDYLASYARVAGIDTDALNQFRSRVASYLSDHQLPQSRMALFLASTKDLKQKDGTKITPTMVQELIDKGEKGEDAKPPQALANAMRAEASHQVGSDGKVRLNGFKTDQALKQFGRKPARKPATKSGTPPADSTASAAAWEAALRDTQGVSRKLAGEQLYKLTSALVVNCLQAHAAPSEGENKTGLKDAREYLAAIATLCEKFGARFDEQSGVTDEDVLKLIWKDAS